MSRQPVRSYDLSQLKRSTGKNHLWEMRWPRVGPTIMSMLFVSLIAAGCALSAPAAISEQTGAEARVYFIAPDDQERVSSPVAIAMGADNFTIEPAGMINENAGHLHLMVDVPCVESGQTITKDDAHLHFGNGQMEAELLLPPGEHTLCLQAADGVHTALDGAGMTDEISIVVE